MKKQLLILSIFAFFLAFPSGSQAAECYSHVDVPTDQTLQVVSSVNVRDGSCMEGTKVIGGLVGGQLAQVIAVNDGWYKVQVNETLAGWVWGDYLIDPKKTQSDETHDSQNPDETKDSNLQDCYKHDPVPTEQTLKVKQASNLRDGACFEETAILTVLYPGEVVETIQVDDGWYNIKREDGTTGWIWSDLLTSDLKAPLKTDSVELTEAESTLTGTPLFKDIQGTLYQTYIEALHPEVLKGNEDGTYKPYASINRAEFTMIMIRALLKGEENIPGGFNINCFGDVPIEQWYTEPICYAKSQNIINGYPDSFFRPGNNINGAEAFKIIVETFQLPKKELQAGQEWYETFAQAMSDEGAIPPTLKSPADFVSREEMAAMIYAVINKKALPHSTQFSYFPQDIVPALQENESEELKEPEASEETDSIDLELEKEVDPQPLSLRECVEKEPLAMNMDYGSMIEEVLETINKERTKRGLEALKPNEALNASSMIWALHGKAMEEKSQDQTFDEYQQSIGLKDYELFGESSVQRLLECGEEGCTAKNILSKVKESHVLFMDQESNPEGQRKEFDHIVDPNFTEFGFGFSIKEDRVLLVYHFSKNVVGDRLLLCKHLE